MTVGIDPSSPYANEMLIPTQNAVNQWNWLTATTGNVVSGAGSTVPDGEFDFESVVLHELGHALGLGHTNLGPESGLALPDWNYGHATTGLNGTYDLDPGIDGIKGSWDDQRGDDENANYFFKDTNNPFEIVAKRTYDSTTYSRDAGDQTNNGDLPSGHSYATSPDRAVAAAMGYANTEAVMQVGAVKGEAQRSLTADDVAGIRYAMSGIDELAGTADDYAIDLQFVGHTVSADIVIDFDNGVTPFAQTNIFLLFNQGANHKAFHLPKIYFSDATATWHFNDTLYTPVLGDLDLDGDVDNQDIQVSFTSFTGPGTTTWTFDRTRSQGDVHPVGVGDRDVDNEDIMNLFSSFTGPISNDTADIEVMLYGTQDYLDATIPDLIYDPVTGEVILDADNSSIIGYRLISASNDFLPANHSLILNDLSTSTSAELSETSVSAGEGSIGFVFPTGLDLAGLSALLAENEVSRYLGAPLVPFDLVVLGAVPEPSTFLLAIPAFFGLGLLVAIRRRIPSP